MSTPKEELIQHKFILFVSDHYNPLCVARSLGQEGIKPIAIVVSKKPKLLKSTIYINTLHCVATYEEGYQLLIEKYSNESLKPFLYASNDRVIEELDSHYDELKEKFYFFNAGEQGRLHQLMNKDTIVSMAEEVGFRAPKSEVVEHGQLPKTLKYPIITKTIMSIMGGWKNDVFICENEEQLKEAYKSIKTPQLIIQEFITKKTECCFEGFAANGGQDVYIPFQIKYLRASKKSYGHYMTVEPLKDETLREKLYELMRRTRFEGIFDIEFLLGEDNELYFLEVNFRSTTWSYTMTRGGVNAPVLWAKAMLDGNVDFSEIHPDKEAFTAMVEFADFADSVKTHKVGFRQWLKEVKGCKCLFYWDRKDRKPFITVLKGMIRNRLR